MANRSADATVPAHDAVAVVTSDTTVIPATRGIYVGATGDIAVRMIDQATPYNTTGNTVIFRSVPVGILPVQVDKILFTGTSASSMLALY